MSQVGRHEATRVPVTALGTLGPLVFCAEGPHLRLYHRFKFLATKQIFEGQAIHGIAVHAEHPQYAFIAIWGGCLVRLLRIDSSLLVGEVEPSIFDHVCCTAICKTTDWLLDLCFGPSASEGGSSGDEFVTCAAVTAHDALLELKLDHDRSSEESHDLGSLKVSELTSSTRSILYSADVLWEDRDRILIAAGTAFGEIIYWSWSRGPDGHSSSRTHHVFLGHEGSIFGVEISKEFLDISSKKPTRLLASCSDDRTIRIWDVSGDGSQLSTPDIGSEAARTRHTGFSNEAIDMDVSSAPSLAIGWGHTSRVWTARFLDADVPGASICLLSSGEDATSRVWHLVASIGGPTRFDLKQVSCAAYHNGKNIWSEALYEPVPGIPYIVCGGADSKITARVLSSSLQPDRQGIIRTGEYTVEDIVAIQTQPHLVSISPKSSAHKSSKVSEFFRNYAFVDSETLLLTTNSGKVYLEKLSIDVDDAEVTGMISDSKLLDEKDDLRGYSICAAHKTLGVAFVAGSRGSIYMYRQNQPKLSHIYSTKGKAGSLFVASTTSKIGVVNLLVTLMGQSAAYLLSIETGREENVLVREVALSISESMTGSTITSMEHVVYDDTAEYIFLGFRGGSIAIYSLTATMNDEIQNTTASLIRIIPQVHGKETVTSMMWTPSGDNTPFQGYLTSVGRDSCVAIHSVDLSENSVAIVHNVPLAIGPNIEGLYFKDSHLIVYGFSSVAFVQYDTTSEEEIMSVETGGSHRSWAFRPQSTEDGGGTLVWTRASTMHIRTQKQPNHVVIRSGGHGREIKAVTARNRTPTEGSRQLVATGAEDTDIKIFEYVDGDFVCRRTLRKHVTGIQHLQWSEDGEYLFSSGGCEEFYVWRVRFLPSSLGIGVVCESICTPKSDHPDLRIMSFDVQKRASTGGYLISMVYSDSKIGVYSYDVTAAQRWRVIATGTYFTSCLTQTVFLPDATILTAGTDGHAVFWALPESVRGPHENLPADSQKLTWKDPIRIHQNASKTLVSQLLENGHIVVVSGGDDGSLCLQYIDVTTCTARPPIIVNRAHSSAVTACAVASYEVNASYQRFYLMTSGNDQWIRVWEVTVNANEGVNHMLDIRRIKRLKTNVADVSSMTVLPQRRVLITGVGMEVTDTSLVPMSEAPRHCGL
ncbi:WD repeat protein-like protein [Aaosphaeria arxii CBS 175.79]|uniref:WD repeat protein-like protein n=1 Tax=Aaosphaeria arxii CBS 175.79 TaxID=1450172 RepID=A0A6A5YAC2_9PLEO|nr:WD repeat protein-like protein [Aaosphaeria arxii CBS 175.79]KAF2021967.1 WD repeat protein-like protein [Aaosphaeria arxii CBS 175.79]